MKKYIYAVYSLENDEGMLACAEKISTSLNLKHVIEGIKDLVYFNVCESYKEAKHIAEVWNQAYKENGNHMYWNKDGSIK